MKKRLISACLLAALLFAGCSGSQQGATVKPVPLPSQRTVVDPTGYMVKDPMVYPDYTMRKVVPLTMRNTAVRAMRDLLSLQWSTATPIQYKKTGPVDNKLFQHEADVTYCGTIYSNASTGIFQFLEFYNYETGRLVYPGPVDELKETLGNSCADSLIWGWTSVCNSITGPYYPATMVYANGYLPVGDYTYDYSITNYNQLPTYKIIEQHDKQVILKAYAQMKPADALVSTSDNHGMMAISTPVVHYNLDGTVNEDASYIMIQDQRGGRGTGFYEMKDGQDTLYYSGRTSYKFTFKELYKKHYLPVTTAEFAGLKEYEEAEVTTSGGSTKSVDGLLKMTVKSNYPLAVVNVIVADQFGSQAVIGRKLFSGAGEEGVPREFALSELECLQNFKDSEYNTPSYTVKIEVVPSTGQRFIAAEVNLK